MRYFIHLSYDGKRYCGWQTQPNDITVQATLEESLGVVLNHAVAVTGCGRTDSGVHARSFYAHFDTDAPLPQRLVLRLNKMLPADIGIYDITPVAEDAHARFDAQLREYRYFIHFTKDAFLQERSYWLHSQALNMDLMNEAAGTLLSFTDFTTFEKRHGGNKTSDCDVRFARWEAIGPYQWCFTIKADRFLRNMVRRIVGALLSVGAGQMSAEEIEKAMQQKAPLHVNFAPPAHGLFLWSVEYPKKILIE